MATRYLLRRDTSADWADANPILAQGEPGVETDTRRFKVGDGVSVWTALPYAADAVGAAAVAQAAAIAAAATDATTKAGAAQAAAQSYADGTFVPAAGLDTATAAVVTPGGSATAAAIAADPALKAAFVSGFDISRFINGNGTTDDTDEMLAAISAAKAAGKRTLLAPTGATCLISAPIDLQGLSLVSPGGFKVLANPATAPTAWKFAGSAADNDVALFFAIGHNDWSIVGITIDGQGSYVKGMTAWGGDNITFARNTVKNTGSAPIQFMGSRRSGTDIPVTNSRMTDNHVSTAPWSYTLDGQIIDCAVVDNTSVNCFEAHLSIDPGEATDTAKQSSRGITASGNTFKGSVARPGGWYDPGFADSPVGAIRVVRAPVGASITGNYIDDWPAYGAWLENFKGLLGSNVFHTSVADIGAVGNTGVHLVSSLGGALIANNSFMGWSVGVLIDASATNSMIGPNHFDGVTTRYSFTTLGAGMVLQDNVLGTDSTGIFTPEPISCKVTRSTTLAVTSTQSGGTWTPVPFDTEVWDDRTFHDPVTNPERLTLTAAGRYELKASVPFASDASGYREARLVKNGSTVLSRVNTNAINGVDTLIDLVGDDLGAVGDYYTVEVRHNSTTASLNLSPTNSPIGFTIKKTG